MTAAECLSLIKTKNAYLFEAATQASIIIANTNLQRIHAAMIPQFLQNIYQTTSCISLGNAYIFGPNEIQRGTKYPIPSILKINQDFIGNKNLFGKTIFGRNDLFLFVTDALGTCYMVDNLTLSVLRQYEDPYKALIDCLIIGQI